MSRKAAFVALTFLALSTQAQASDALRGFSLYDKAINPVCIKNMLPNVSDSGIIIKSIVLEACQESNWAHYKNLTVTDDVVTAEMEKESFSYQVIGKTKSGDYVLKLSGNKIAAFRISEQLTPPNYNSDKTHILTVVSESFVPCLKSVKLEEDKVLIEQNEYDPKASHAQQCKGEIKTLEYKLPIE